MIDKWAKKDIFLCFVFISYKRGEEKYGKINRFNWAKIWHINSFGESPFKK